MAKFVEFENPDGVKHYVNVDNIAYFDFYPEGANYITFVGANPDNYLDIKDTLKDVKSKLFYATNEV